MAAGQWVMIGFIIVLLILFPLLTSRKNKIENQKIIEQANSLKRGDEVLTNSGIYGKILEVKQDGEAKKVVIETGNDKNKSTVTVDAYAIYVVLNNGSIKEQVENQNKDKTNIEVEKNEDKGVDKKEDGVKSKEKIENKSKKKESK